MIVFLTDADPSVGLGHLYRCQALAQALAERAANSRLIVNSASGVDWVVHKLSSVDFELANWVSSPSVTASVVDGCRCVIVDSYRATTRVRRLLSEGSACPVYFDDGEIDLPARGIAVDPTPGRDDHNRSGKLRHLHGPSYQVLRKPFWSQPQRKTMRQVRQVGIAVGGADPQGLMSELAGVVRTVFATDVRIRCIGALSSELSRSDCLATGFLEAESMKQVIDEVDLLVTAGGQTLCEAVSRGTPAIVVETATNQRRNVRGWVDAGVAIAALSPAYPDWLGSVRDALIDLASYEQRVTMTEKALSFQLHESTHRLANTLSELVGLDQ